MATALKVSPHWLIVRAGKNRRNAGERGARISGGGSGGGGPARLRGDPCTQLFPRPARVARRGSRYGDGLGPSAPSERTITRSVTCRMTFRNGGDWFTGSPVRGCRRWGAATPVVAAGERASMACRGMRWWSAGGHRAGPTTRSPRRWGRPRTALVACARLLGGNRCPGGRQRASGQPPRGKEVPRAAPGGGQGPAARAHRRWQALGAVTLPARRAGDLFRVRRVVSACYDDLP